MRKILIFSLLALSTAANAQIYQCGNTLTDQPCGGAKMLASQSTFSGVHADAQGILYECKRPNERQIWYDTRGCPKGYQQMARHDVPAGVSLKNKIYIVEMRKQGRRILDNQKASAGIVPSHVTRRESSNCKSIDAQIKNLDERMRAPQSASSMSNLSAQRRKLSDRRFRECR